jgi:pilus assembly protein Flp/PilA
VRDHVTANSTQRDCAPSYGALEDPMTTLLTHVRALLRNDEGQDLIEYALLAGLIALVAVVAITNAGTEVNGIFNKIVTKLQTANK